MTDKYRMYRVLYPFRVKRQRALREARHNTSLAEFQSEMGTGPVSSAAAAYLWERLRELAFVEDFKPSPSDDFGDVFALAPDSVWDDVVEGLIDHLGLQSEHLDFTGFSLESLRNARDIVGFVEKVATLQGRPKGTRFG